MVKRNGSPSPELSPVDSSDEESVYDSEDGLNPEEENNSEDEDGFEDQGSSSEEDEDIIHHDDDDDDDSVDDGIAVQYEKTGRSWKNSVGFKRFSDGSIPAAAAPFIHTDDISSDEDDDDGKGNRIGRVPLHWYDEYDHVGYTVDGEKVGKNSSDKGDRIDQALAHADGKSFVVHDALNDRPVELSQRQIELIRRVQAGAYAHPEHDANPEYIDYFSGVDKQISGLSSNTDPPKARFQPSKWDKMQVDRLLDSLEKGKINMDYLTGKIRDMNDANKPKGDPDQPFQLWQDGTEEDLLNTRKGPQHIAAPKLPPPGHAASYIPPDEYLPTEEEIKQWQDMPLQDRPHGHLVPKKFPNLRSVGAYQHSVREAFERCLDLYLCPRLLKRRLNIDPESLVPQLPRTQDLKPFPTTKCIEYVVPKTTSGDDDDDNTAPPLVRCVSPSPDGEFVASGSSDGCVRLWEVQTGRLLRTWDLVSLTEHEGDTPPSAVSMEWNPNKSHHCLLVAIGKCVVVLATGTAGKDDAELTQALLAAALQGGRVQDEASNNRASKAVEWVPVNSKATARSPMSSFDTMSGPVCILRMTRDVTHVRWQVKGDYFCSVSPKAGAAAVLVHQLSKGNSQQPFSKAKGESQLACFHPNKPFLFVANQNHVRVYHLVQQRLVKRLVSGCRWISSMDIHHSSGDHLIVGSLDRRVVWFDLDLGTAPYKTLKYHEKAVRAVQYHRRYPLMVSVADDGAIHVFHSMVYSDLMRNPLVVPVKILRGHTVSNRLGVLATAFHPTQPWLFSGGADGNMFLFQDI